MVHKLLNTGIALVWLINGLICKVLNLVPRHRLIVARILGETHAGILTIAIGVTEILMAAWVLSGIKHRICALTQVLIIATMNVIEFVLAPDLLLFSRVNAIVAVFFIAVILVNEYTATTRGKAKQDILH
jgi:hypothetical protein